MEIKIDNETTLKQISPSHADELFKLVSNNLDKSLVQWCPDLKKTYATLETTLDHIDDANSKFEEDKSPDFVIYSNDQLAGLISLSPIYEEKSEVGYWLGHEFEGKGLITRSFPALLKYAKETLELKGLEISTAVMNVRSHKAAIKFGFVQKHTVKGAEKLDGKWVDHIIWGLTF